MEQKIAEKIDTEASKSLQVSFGGGGVEFSNANQVMEFAKMMAVSGVAVRKHLRNNPGVCLAVVIQAIEWKMSPYAVANKSYAVNDQLAFESQLVQAVILQRAPIKGRFRYHYSGEGGKRRVRIEATTTDGEVVDYESPELSKIPVQNSPLWKGDPDQQLGYYAGRALCRRHFPDVLLGVYTPEDPEMDRRSPEDARDITPAKGLGDRMAALADRSEPAAEKAQPEREQEDSFSDVSESTEAGTAVSQDYVETAYHRGDQAKRSGMSRRAMPGEYRDSAEMAEAWLRGWDEAPAPADDDMEGVA